MNQFTEARLQDELNAYIGRVDGRQQQEWRDNGVEVSKDVAFKSAKDGRHTGSVDFHLHVPGKKPQTARALFVYAP